MCGCMKNGRDNKKAKKKDGVIRKRKTGGGPKLIRKTSEINPKLV